MSELLLIRADASAGIGTGHVMRGLALAQEWQRQGGGACFAYVELNRSIRERLRIEGMALQELAGNAGSREDAEATAALAHKLGATWVVVDGYQFGSDFQKGLKKAGLRVLFLDDFGHASPYCADLVLNQNLNAKGDLYVQRSPETEILLGSRFSLLRREFLPWCNLDRKISSLGRHVLITLGGSDPTNATGRVLEALRQVGDLEVVVLIGGANPHRVELEALCCGFKSGIRVEVDVANVSELMAWADVAIAAGGSTSWELAFMGLPSLLIVIAENQRANAEEMEKEGISRNLGDASGLQTQELTAEIKSLLQDYDKRTAMSRQGRLLVDGEGAARLLMRLKDSALRMRPVREEDCRLLWEWANEAGVRAAAFSTKPIDWDEHQKWFHLNRRDAQTRILIAVDQADTPIGQARFNWNGSKEAEIHVSLSQKQRGSGLGTRVIDAATKELFRQTEVAAVHAYVRSDNIRSQRAFEKASFVSRGEETIKGHPSFHYFRQRIAASCATNG